MTELFLRLVNNSINAGWLILAVLVLRILLRRAPKRVRPWLWGLVGLRLLVPLSWESAMSLLPTAETIPLDIAQAPTPAIHSGIGAVNALVNPVLEAGLQPSVGESANPLQILLPVLTALWLLGVAAMAAYALGSYVHLRRKTATAVLLRENLYESEAVSSPFVLGLFRPKILLPFDLAADQAELVIAHEQAHLRRRDHWWKPLGYLLLAVYWFQPLVWVAYVLLCRDLELACDEAVIGTLSPTRRADYSQTLLQCSTAGRLAACPLSFGEVGVKTRIKAVLSYRKSALWILVAAVAVCLVTAICFLTTPPSPLGKITVTAAEVWNIPAEQGYDLSPAELSELQSRLEDLDLGGVMDSYQGFTPLYTMSITDEAGKGYTLSVFNTEGTHAGMLVDGVYYRIESEAFVDYLMGMANGASRTEVERQMTLKDVRALAEKGEALTWGDLEDFAYTETGSGLYIRIFEVEGGYTLAVGGGLPNAEDLPMYAHFSAGEAAYIDLRTGDLEAFLAGEPPYLLYLSRADVQVFDGAGYDFGYVTTITEPGAYTIVAEAQDAEGNSWGKLKSGLGWIDLDRALEPVETQPPVTVSYADPALLGTGAYEEFAAEESEFTSYLLFTPLEPITDVTLSLASYLGAEEMEPLSAWDSLEKPLMAAVVFYGDMTTYVLSFTDGAGTAQQYAVSLSGRNGALVWTQLHP